MEICLENVNMCIWGIKGVLASFKDLRWLPRVYWPYAALALVWREI